MVMDVKERLVNAVTLQLNQSFNGEQLRKIKIVLELNLKNLRIEEDRHEIIIYDETSDIAAYKQYFVSKKIQGLSDNSLRMYRYAIDRFMRTVRVEYSRVSANDIRLYLANREMVDGISRASLARERGAICCFFTWLFDEEYISRNPARKVERIKTEKRVKEAFSDIEVEKLRSACQTSKELAVIELLLSTGCRVSELIGLHYSTYDIRNDRISIVGKGNKERHVYLNAKAKVALAAYEKMRPGIINEGYLLQNKWMSPEGEWVLKKNTTGGIQKLVKRLGERAGVSNVHPHRFRRTAATFARRRGMELEMVKEFLGHEQMDTTLRYTQINDRDVHAAHLKYVS